MGYVLGLVLLLCPLFSPAVQASENLATLITQARTLDRDAVSSTRQRFTDAQITGFINDAQRQAMATTHCLTGSMTFSLLPGVTYYALPSNFLSMDRVTLAQVGNIMEMSPGALDGRSRGWELTSGHPVYYFINFSSRGLLGFAPFPQTAGDTDTVKAEFYIQANDLASPTDLPYNGAGEFQDYHQGLAYYAAALMAAIDGQGTQSTGFMSVFSGTVGTMKARCMERPRYMPSAAGTQ